jgi:hypothetical protein
MRWGWWVVCGTVLLVSFGTGCEAISVSLSTFAEDPGPREHVLPGTPDKQAVALQAALVERDLRPQVTPGEDTTVIDCRSSSGQPFKIVLRRTLDGRTCARVTLNGRADDDTKALLAQLDLR